MIERRRFSELEAQSKLGQRIRSLVEFSGVPKGTTGRVAEINLLEKQGWEVVIEWDLPRPQPVIAEVEIAGEPATWIRTGRPLRHWFTKDEYEKYLIEE